MEPVSKTNNKTIQAILHAPLWTFVISFSLGTILLLLYLIDKDQGLIIIGLLYVAAAFVLNLVALLILIALSFIHKEYQNAILLNSSVILLNTPIAIVYFLIIINN
jgi:hypothetical protein